MSYLSHASKLVEAIDRLLDQLAVMRGLAKIDRCENERLTELQREATRLAILVGVESPPELTKLSLRNEHFNLKFENAEAVENWKQAVLRIRAVATLCNLLHEFSTTEQALRDNPDCKNSLGIACSVWRSFPRRMWQIDGAAKKAGPRMKDVFGTMIDFTEADRGKAASALISLHVRATAVLVRFAKLFDFDPKPIEISSTYCRQVFREGRVPADLELTEDALWWPDLLNVVTLRTDTVYTDSLAAWNTVQQLRDKARDGGFGPVELPAKGSTEIAPAASAVPLPAPTSTPAGANGKKRKKPGPKKPRNDPAEDAKICNQWENAFAKKTFRDYEECDKAHGYDQGTTGAAVARHRGRERRVK